MSLAWPMLAAVGAAGATWLYENGRRPEIRPILALCGHAICHCP